MYILSALLGFGIGVVLIYVTKQKKQLQNSKIFGIYSQPGKWYFIKYHVFLFLLVLRRLKYYIFGKSLFHNVNNIEKLQPLSSHELAFDAVFFQAVSQNGIYFCMGTERRHQAKVNGLVYLLIPEYGALLSEKLPKTTLDADPASLLSNKEYAAEGIRITPIVPMKLWKISFKGKMRQLGKPNKLVDVDFEAEWNSNLPWFLFEVEIPLRILARAIARETWTEKFFKSLKE
ncbi:hypothetical protein NQ315_000023 [Exocentrus adspersus]|uniref:Uncharacterized protein n=1 Tax=Exocentrus adspersus TaxID=1586481 RepID=A0AAV8VG19_9CUCU|nr:hypothetical protein NQ315_000023 [Exocentrus adspersus]